MYYAIYKITNQINGKFYIGSHKTKDLNDNYMGSGKYLKYSQKKYGIENFKKEILFVFETSEEMYAKENEIVNEDLLASENTYNLKIGGFGGFDYINQNNLSVQNLQNKSIKEKTKNSFLKRHKIEGSTIKETLGKIKGAETRKKLYENNVLIPPFKGKSHTLETKKKISVANSVKQSGMKNSQFNTMWITNGTINSKISKVDTIPYGFKKGRTLKK